MTARGVDIDPFVDAYSIHYYRLSFDYLTGNPAHREVATTIRDAVDKHTAKIARYCRARGKPLWAPEIGTFHYGWRFGDPAGPTTLEATLTVAEALLRAANAGVDAFAFWCFMNPNTIDGHWRIVGIEDGRLVRARLPVRDLRPPQPARPAGIAGAAARVPSARPTGAPTSTRPPSPRPRASAPSSSSTTTRTRRSRPSLAVSAGVGGLPSACRRVARGALAEPCAPAGRGRGRRRGAWPSRR